MADSTSLLSTATSSGLHGQPMTTSVVSTSAASTASSEASSGAALATSTDFDSTSNMLAGGVAGLGNLGVNMGVGANGTGNGTGAMIAGETGEAGSAIGAVGAVGAIGVSVSPGSSGASAPNSRSSSVSRGTKRKRVVLSIHEKQQVLQRLDAGEQPVLIAKDFGISRQQVSDIKKNKDRILSFCVDAKHLSTLRRKTLKATCDFHPGVEQELYRWVIRQRRLGRVVTSEGMTNKATDLFVQYCTSEDNVSFKSIANWLRQFKKLHGLKTLSHEEIARLPEKFSSSMEASSKSRSMTVATTTATGAAPGSSTMTPTSISQNQNGTSNPQSMVMALQTANATPTAVSSSAVAAPGSFMASTTSPFLFHPTQDHGSSPSSAMAAMATTTSSSVMASNNFLDRFDLQQAQEVQLSGLLAANDNNTANNTSSNGRNQSESFTALHERQFDGHEQESSGDGMQGIVDQLHTLASDMAQFEQTMTEKMVNLDSRLERISFALCTSRFP